MSKTSYICIYLTPFLHCLCVSHRGPLDVGEGGRGVRGGWDSLCDATETSICLAGSQGSFCYWPVAELGYQATTQPLMFTTNCLDFTKQTQRRIEE
jgi:hypothetical protein